MKYFKYLILFLISTFAVSCAWDNYDKPESQLTGRIVYQGEPLGLSKGEVRFELYEPGWQLKAPINVTVDDDGSFSALLFDADYKLIIPQNRGPFKNITTNGSDTILVSLRGNTVKDIEVMPYYMVRNTQITAAGRVITATFRAEKIITGTDEKNIERVNLYVNKTMLVDNRDNYNIVKSELGGGAITDPNSITLTLTVPALTIEQNYVFARVGIKMAGVEKMIFSPVQKLTLQ